MQKIHKRLKVLSDHTKGVIYGVLSGIGVSGYVLVNRHVYTQYHVRPLAYAVTFAASTGLCALLGLTVRKLRRQPIPHTPRKIGQFLVIGLAGGSAMALVAVGGAFTSAVNTGIVMTSSLITTALFSRLLLGDRYTKRQNIWLAVMFAGLYLGVVGLHLVQFRLGDVIILGAMTILGFNNTFSKFILKDTDAYMVADARLFISGVLMLIIGFTVLGQSALVTTVGWWPLLAGAFLWMCIRTFYASVHLLSPNVAIVLNNAQIFFTALAGVLLLAEPYDWVKFTGSILVLTSVYYISKK